MVHIIYGHSGSGKSAVLYKYLESDIKNNNRIFFIVPEQETVAVEREIVSRFPASAQLSVEVLNFSRLCNRIFRTYGGISYTLASKQTKALIMWNTLRELSPMLEEYRVGDPADFSLTQMMLSAIQELKAYCISPIKLESACSSVDETSSLYKKLRDISLIYSAYSAELEQSGINNGDDITKALEILKTNNFFANSCVYLDSFAGFTKQEFEFIARIAELCDELYITLPIPTPNDRSIHLEGLRQTVAKLKKCIGSIDYDETFITESSRSECESVNYLKNNIWRFDADPLMSNDNALKSFICETPYSESEIVASEICREIQSGARYKDIAIILRDPQKYRGILDTTLEKYGIPFYMSEKTDLMVKSLSKFIFSALKIKETNWRGENVIAHLKSGFCDIDPYEADLFEDYVSTWRISGNKFLDEIWTMNPDGYSAIMSARGERILSVANSVKARIVPRLSLYFARLDASGCIKDMCQATLEFLKDSDITRKVRESCKANLERGNKKAADEDMKLYSLTLSILYDLSNTLGDKELNVEEFSAALNLMFSQSDIGTIPTSADEVLVGSADMLRAGKIKSAYLMGLNEGEFPAAVKDNGIFSDSDKSILSELDLELSSDTSIKTSEELFFAYRAISVPKKRLILSCSLLSSDGSSQRQSIVMERVKRLLPLSHHIIESELSPIDRIWNKESAKSAYSTLRNPEDRSKYRALIDENNGIAYIDPDAPISKKECAVSPEIVQKLFGERLSLTQSRLERYVLCGFDYYCTYVLGLRESKRAIFQLNDIGTFIHYILEGFMKEITRDGKLTLDLSNDELDIILKKIVSDYLFELLGEDYSISNRTKHLFMRLNKLSFMIAKNLIDEFKESDFYPSRFELKVGMGKDSIDALELKLKDGSTVSLRGIADRVDTYKKDGNVYIRVVDYKTGSKEFSFDDLKDGLNTQLLIYLFSICYTKNADQRMSLGCDENGKLIPAGIQYLSSNAPIVSIDKMCEGEEIEKLIKNEFSRSGLLTDDPEVLHAMNHSLDSRFVSKTKIGDDGAIIGKSLITQSGFDELYDMLSQTIIEIAQSMRDGKADAIPLRTGENAPCRYCKMKAVCRASACKSKI